MQYRPDYFSKTQFHTMHKTRFVFLLLSLLGLLALPAQGKVPGWNISFKTQNLPVDEAIPVVVLVDAHSASASEVTSGALQDLDRAVIMGQRSFGKGLVQNMKEIGYNAKIKLTTAKYYTPSGRCIQSVRYKDGKPVDIAETERGQFKTRIVHEIEQEIVGRYYFQRGKVRKSLKNDPEVDEAVRLLNDPVRYKALLSVQG